MAEVAPGGPGVVLPGSMTEAERHAFLRRHNRERQAQAQRAEELQKRKDKEMAAAYVKHCAEQREMRQAEVSQRLAKLQESQRKIAERPAPAMQTPRNVDAPCEQAAMPGLVELSDKGSSGGGHREMGSKGSKSTKGSDPALGGSFRDKRRRSEAPVIIREKPISSEMRALVQGLCRNKEGQRILAAASPREKALREALAGGDPDAVQAAEHAVQNGGDDEIKAADSEAPPPKLEHHLQRRFELRMMRKVGAQVVGCRRKMRAAYPTAFDPDAPRNQRRDVDPWATITSSWSRLPAVGAKVEEASEYQGTGTFLT